MPALVPLTTPQRRIVLACWMVGGLLRLLYVVVLHPATLHVYSDMNGYFAQALRRAAGTPETIGDSLYPPGTGAFFGWLVQLDPAWNLAAVAQWLISLGIMALTWAIARRLYGNATAVLSLALLTLYLPVIHYAGLFLAENPFTFSLLAAFWLLLCAIEAVRSTAAIGYGLAAGFMTAVAAALKATVLLPMLLCVLVWISWALRHRQSPRLGMVLGVALGFAVLVVPLSQRCTRLADGAFCLISTNTGMNVLMGHYGERSSFTWRDTTRNTAFSFTSPSATLHGYTEAALFDFAAYDVAANMQEARSWLREHPVTGLRLSLRNVADLFVGRTLWPAAVIGDRDWGALYQRIFWLVVLVPALAWLLIRLPAMLRLRADTLAELLLIAAPIGLMATAFVSLGEVRFRIPFDPLLIVLAARGLLLPFTAKRSGPLLAVAPAVR